MSTKSKALDASTILAGESKVTEQLSNRLAVQGEFLPRVAEMGAKAAEGELSHAMVCFEFQRLCGEGVFEQSDAKKVYTAYVNAFNAKVTERPDLGVEIMGADTLKVGASILGTFGHPSVAAQGAGLYDRIRVLRNKIKAEERAAGSTTSHFARVNRFIAGKATKVVDPKSVTISDEEIITCLSKEPKADKGLLEQFKPLADLAMKLAKTNRFDGLAPIAESLVAMMGEIAAGRGVIDAAIADLMKGGAQSTTTVQ